MSTVFDWLTVLIFAGLSVVYLQRSIGPRPPHDAIWKYLPPAVLCMVANYLGNEGWILPATALMFAAVVYARYVICPQG